MKNLTILNNQISTFENLYSLNDLHKASGSNKNHQPTFFIRNTQTQELIAEIETENNRSANSQIALKIIKGGNSVQGTFACKEIVIAYAMWISPKFHLVVLRAFLEMYEQPKSHTQTKPINIPKKLNVGGVIVHPIKINGQAYFTARELAWAFGYTKSDAILRKYREYKRLFKEGMVQTAQHYVTNLVGKRTLTLSYAFNIDALRLIEAQMNPKARRNTFRLGLARLERALENPQLNLPIQQPDLPVQISPTVIEKPIGLNPGRWFVNVDDNCNITTLKNLDGQSIVEAELYDQLKGETRMMAKLMQELAERMKIASGECSPSRFDIPLLQPKNL
ncbi:KilA-N domain-containing protein [Pasteurella atlantica]|uniref:KilA-N domain-containing protein n=2 Tax=Pasteurellaceae TaxID=712 RepID=A0ACC6HJJ3_9PAST|nr:KilA-N domain-containing protein [Pasteurella atlantica]MDP8051022.1 KilA-N domain-containing protein [Pasteurella atlantica]MDP8104318.1 KilA-N domain-containing protein [Pasteurella atlantica]MDP8147678.1 KilA-N domain-containing protein [Pasteurella atlantica]